MTTSTRWLVVGGISVEVVRKEIKNLHLGVYPPAGRVRVAAPLALTDDAIRLAVVEKLAWIKRQRAAFAAQPRQSEREMVRGESHYFLGQRYRLSVHEQEAPPRVAIRGLRTLDLCVRPGTDREQRLRVLESWYRAQLKTLVGDLLAAWQPRLDVEVAAWGVKKMKTKWGSCTTAARRIWLNLELAKKPPRTIEYVVVHELMHLIEASHSDRFLSLMSRHLPDWQARRKELQHSPLGAEKWTY